jgi:Cof subfamily protein (haloacid dehalogenase superfamily)
MAYKLIALDLDGTLLTDERALPTRNIEAMRAAIEAGAEVMIATGRPYLAAAKIFEQAGIRGLILSAAGALIKSYPEGETLYEAFLAPDAMTDLVETCRENGWFWFCFSGLDYYIEEVCDDSRTIEGYIGLPAKLLDYRSDHHISFNKGTVMVDPAAIQSAAELLRRRIGDRAEVLISDKNIIDITPKGIVKGVSVLNVAKLRGLSAEQVIAIGDTDSDISMIQAAGLGVCMANGTAAAKAAAEYIAPSNNECGVAHVIETFVLK